MRLASRGQREIGGRVERIDDPELRAALRSRAKVLFAQSLLIAALVSVAVAVAASRT